MKIIKSYEKLSNEKIKSFESEIGFILPQDYKNFMLQNNGGEPIPCDFEFEDMFGEISESSVQYFLPIGNELLTNVEKRYYYFLENERIPKGIVPIAPDNFGNLICLCLLEKEYGSVYFWDHELEDEETNLSFIAKSFDEFLNLLKDFD